MGFEPATFLSLDNPLNLPSNSLPNNCTCVSPQDGKDYIPLTSGEEAEGPPVTPDPRSIYYRPQSGDALEAQLHYDSPPALGSVSTFHRFHFLE